MSAESCGTIPLSDRAGLALSRLAHATGSAGIAALTGEKLLRERVEEAGMTIPGRVSAGGGCRLLEATGDVVALNLARPADRELLPALFEAAGLDATDDEAIAGRVRESDAEALVARGRLMGLAMARMREARRPSAAPWVELIRCPFTPPSRDHRPRVLDLSALWAGPLAGRLLQLAGCEVVKVESRTRPDALRHGQPGFYARLNGDKAQRVLDLHTGQGRRALLDLVAEADIVIEAARPRALHQLGIDADALVRARPGLVWLTLTGHGAQGDAAGWVGFGDDCGVAGGLSAALFDASGHVAFVGDAIADPLTGIHAALCGWSHWSLGQGGRFGLAMSEVVSHCLDRARRHAPARLEASLQAWAAAEGEPFPTTPRRHVAPPPGRCASRAPAPC